jgi:4-diphosphocytidyl-2-C-methyl-D-erythritol kinase
MMRALAFAKVNLALTVNAPSADGYHPLRGIYQSISLTDTITVEPAREDAITVSNREAPEDDTNLAWRAVDTARRTARISQPFAVDLVKAIPAGAGLGGGSADAAAALGLMARRYGIDDESASEIAEGLGADVPFAFVGGTMLGEGRGERLTRLDPLEGFALAVVVPPFSMSTPDVFRRWDELDGPLGPVVPDRALPPKLRGGLAIRNDLYPAAVDLDRRIDEWRDELSTKWGTDVAMTGSGSALFAFFAGLDEATDAAEQIDLPTRLSVGVEPVSHGWVPTDA